MNIAEKLFEFAKAHYDIKDFVCLASQYEDWRVKKPFVNLHILDATPIFINTFPKYAALLAGGAKLTLASAPTIPKSERALKELAQFDIEIIDLPASAKDVDIVLDCGASFRDVNAKFGYVELTRTGAPLYANATKPVYVADDSLVKEFETVLGTGDGFARAMQKSGYSDFSKKKILLFGYGKVGRGIAKACIRLGADLSVVDDWEKIKKIPDAKTINLHDRKKIAEAAADAWCIVSATGVRGALEKCLDAEKISASKTLLANMGVEDEFGKGIDSARVLNNKRPLNFILDEPTHLKFIAPTLALHNFGAIKILEGKLSPALNKPSNQDESYIFNQAPALTKALFEEI